MVAEARRTLTALALHGYAVDSVIANRVFPPEAGGLAVGRGLAVRAGRGAGRDRRVGAGAAGAAGERTGPPSRSGSPRCARWSRSSTATDDPLAPAPRGGADGGHPGRRATSCCASTLPFVRRSEVRLARSGDELVLTVGEQRRRLALPSVLRRCVPVGRVRRGRRGPGPVPAGPGAVAAGAAAVTSRRARWARRRVRLVEAAREWAARTCRAGRARGAPARRSAAGARCAARSPCCGVTARR